MLAGGSGGSEFNHYGTGSEFKYLMAQWSKAFMVDVGPGSEFNYLVAQ